MAPRQIVILHWDPAVFDRFWSITFPDGHASLTTSKQTEAG